MRIAHLGCKGIPARGGTERVVEALACRQAAHHRVTVYGSRRVCGSGTLGSVRILALPTVAGKHLGPVILQLACAAHALLLARYDVVHLHGSENAFVLPLLRLRYPVVSTNHGPAYARDKWSRVAKRLIRSVEGLSVHAASVPTAVAASHAAMLSVRHRRRVLFIPNGIDVTERVDVEGATRLLRGLGLEPRSYWLFAAARVDATKGCHTLLEAYRDLDAKPPLLVVGDLFHATGYEASLLELASGQPVHFLPRLEDKGVLLGLLWLARLFVFPSTVEAMSMMLLEAVSLGVPTLASDITENLQVLTRDFPTFKAGDAIALRRRLVESSTDDDARERAVAISARIARRHDWDRIAARYESLYRRVVGARGLRSRTPSSGET